MQPSHEPGGQQDAPVVPSALPLVPVQTAASLSGSSDIQPDLGMTVGSIPLEPERHAALRLFLAKANPTCPNDLLDHLDQLASKWHETTGENIQAEAAALVEAGHKTWSALFSAVSRTVLGREPEILRSIYLAQLLGPDAAHWLDKVDRDDQITYSLERREFGEAYEGVLKEEDRVALLGAVANFHIAATIGTRATLSDLASRLEQLGEIEQGVYAFGLPTRGHEVLDLSTEAWKAHLSAKTTEESRAADLTLEETTRTLAGKAPTDLMACLRLVIALDNSSNKNAECLNIDIARAGVAMWLGAQDIFAKSAYLEDVDIVAESLALSIFGPETNSSSSNYLLEPMGRFLDWEEIEARHFETIRALYREAGLAGLCKDVCEWLGDDGLESRVSRGALVAVDAAMTAFEAQIEAGRGESDTRSASIDHPYPAALNALFKACSSTYEAGVAEVAKVLSAHLTTAARLNIRW